jgi:hypothetical protein
LLGLASNTNNEIEIESTLAAGIATNWTPPNQKETNKDVTVEVLHGSGR